MGIVLVVQTLATFDIMPGTRDAEFFQRVWFVYLQMMRAWLWALLTPVVFELRRRIPFRGWWIPVGIFLHFAFAVALIEWIMVTRIWVWAALPIPSMWSMPFVSLQEMMEQLSPRLLIDVLAYLGTLAAGYILDLLADRQESLLRENDLRLKLTATELQ